MSGRTMDEEHSGGFKSQSERRRVEYQRLEKSVASERNVYYAYWDSSCQCELMRGTEEECIRADEQEICGGGNYNIYPCIVGYRIKEVVGRTKISGLHIWYIEDPEITL